MVAYLSFRVLQFCLSIHFSPLTLKVIEFTFACRPICMNVLELFWQVFLGVTTVVESILEHLGPGICFGCRLRAHQFNGHRSESSTQNSVGKTIQNLDLN